MISRRSLALLVLAVLGVGVIASTAAFAGDKMSREAKASLRKAEAFVRARSTTDADTVLALEALKAHAHLKVTEFLVEKAIPALKADENRPKSYRAALEVLECMIDAESQAYLRKHLENKKLPGPVRAEIARGLLGSVKDLDEEKDLQTLLGLLASDTWQVRVAALVFVADDGGSPPQLLDAIKNCLEFKSRVVRSHALPVFMHYVSNARGREAKAALYDYLITRLMKDESKVKGDIHKALKDATGNDLPADGGLWRHWLTKYKTGKNDAPRPGAKTPRSQVTFFGNVTFAKKVVYVIDRSISMTDPIDPEVLKQLRGKTDDPTAKNKIGQGLKWSKIKTKWDLAKAELRRAILALEEPGQKVQGNKHPRRGRRPRRGRGTGTTTVKEGDVAFTIVSYATDITVWSETLKPATKRNKLAAIEWFDKQTPKTLTNIYGALTKAFDIAEGKVGAPGRRGDGPVITGEVDTVDTIFFLTDGYATTGKLCGDDKLPRSEQVAYYAKKMDQLLAEFKARNELLKIDLHTVGIGQHDRRTLTLLARQNNGEYTPLGKKK